MSATLLKYLINPFLFSRDEFKKFLHLLNDFKNVYVLLKCEWPLNKAHEKGNGDGAGLPSFLPTRTIYT